MDLQTALQKQENEVKTYSDKVAQLLENTIIAKSIFSHDKKNGGWDEIKELFGEDYFNPNFTIFGPTIYEKVGRVDNFSGALRMAVDEVNAKCGKQVFELRPRRKFAYDVIWVK